MAECQMCQIKRVRKEVSWSIAMFILATIMIPICVFFIDFELDWVRKYGLTSDRVIAVVFSTAVALAFAGVFQWYFRYIFIGSLPYVYIGHDGTMHAHRLPPPPDEVKGYVFRLREGGFFRRPRIETAEGNLVNAKIRHDWRSMRRVTITGGGTEMTTSLCEVIHHFNVFKGGLIALQVAHHDALHQRDDVIIALCVLDIEIEESKRRSKSPHAAWIRERLEALLAKLPEETVVKCRQVATERHADALT